MNKDEKILYFLGQMQMYITLVIRNHSGCNSPTYRAVTNLEVFYNSSMQDIFFDEFKKSSKEGLDV